MKRLITIFFLFFCFASFAQNSKAVMAAFEKAKKSNSAEAYTQFIKKYPTSSFSAEAKKLRTGLDKIEIVISSFLGNEKRNFYGNLAPTKMDTIWKVYLGEAVSPAYGEQKVWAGAGWTGQPLFIREAGQEYLIQGAFDCKLKKIDAKTGRLVWEYKFDDILKGSPTLWVNNNAENKEDRYVIIQGSRLGVGKTKETPIVTSLRAVSYISGKELWKMNVKPTASYSRDVDGSCLVINDTAYLALENSLFTVWDPDYKNGTMKDGFVQPKIYKEIQYYTDADVKFHGDDICAEASPTLINRRIFTPSGTGWVYGYNMDLGKNDWEYFIGTDLNGSLPATSDGCILVAVEKQYMPGRGGVMKLDPSKPLKDAVVWYYPTENKKWYHWEGGLIGSVTVNDAYVGENDLHLAVFLDVAGYLTVVDHRSVNYSIKELGPDDKTAFPTPKVIAKIPLEGTIATPIIVGDKIIAPTDKGLFLFQLVFDKSGNAELKLLDKSIGPIDFDASPIAVDGKIYITGRNGYMYCLGNK